MVNLQTQKDLLIKLKPPYFLYTLLTTGFLRSAFQVIFFNVSSDVCVGKDILFCSFGGSLAVTTANVYGF